LHLIMPTDLEKQIDIQWHKLDDDRYVYLLTGESFNNLEYLGAVKREIENAQLKDFHEHSKLLRKYGIDVNRKIKNKGDKTPIETTCIAWKDTKKDLFIKVYRGEGVELIMNKTLDIFEKGFMFTIQSFVEFRTNCVIIDREFPTVEYLAELAGMSPRKANDIIKSLEKKNIIKRYKDGLHKKIFVNPHYMCAGAIIEGEIPSYFVSEIEEETMELFNRQ